MTLVLIITMQGYKYWGGYSPPWFLRLCSRWFNKSGIETTLVAGSIPDIKQWWNILVSRGFSYGCFVNNSKTWLVVKREAESKAQDLFKDCG